MKRRARRRLAVAAACALACAVAERAVLRAHPGRHAEPKATPETPAATAATAAATPPARTAIAGWLSLDPPAAPGAMAPWLAVAGADTIATWIEPAPRRVRFSRLAGGAWSEPTTIASGEDLLANWADTPGLGVAGNGDFYAHWLRRLGEDKYAYGVEIGRSSDGGKTWQPLGFVHEDRSATEHGFVSWAREGQGIRAWWLDGREMAKNGPMTLRSLHLEPGGVIGASGASELVDARVCDCCSTAAIGGTGASGSGPLVAYRDRSEDEVRDVSLARRSADGWSSGIATHADGWKIAGCPVNGPQLVGLPADDIAVAWFNDAPTPAGQTKERVRVAFSRDRGATFGAPVALAGEGAMGRVAMAPSGEREVVVAWLASTESGAELRARRVAADGRRGDEIALVGTTSGRASGFPRLTTFDGRLLLSWVEEGADDRPSRVRAASFPAASLPAPR